MNIHATAALNDPLVEARRLSRLFRETAAAVDASGDFPHSNVEALSAAGLLNLPVAQERGGAGAGLSLARRVISEIASGEPSTALITSMHYVNLASMRSGKRWPTPLADRLIAESLRGSALINSLQVEPEAGSPAYGTMPRTTARRTADGWVLTGRKRFATGCEGLSWMIVSAITDEPEPRFGSFAVARQSEGVSIEKTWDILGMRATGSHDVIFRDVAVPLDHAIDLAPATDGMRRDDNNGSWFMLLIGAVYQGIGRAIRDDLLNFATTFRPGDLKEPLSSLPRIQDEIGAVEILLATNERLLDSAARDADEGRPSGFNSSIVRHVVIENAIKAADLALLVAGNTGLSRQHSFERHYRNVICGRTHAGGGPVARAAAARIAIARAAAGEAE